MSPPTASVLIVDDSPGKLVTMAATLEDLGQPLVTAASGREALRHLLRQDFAVILLDVNMPGLDGFETAALIRQRKRSQHTPIIFVTGMADDETHATRGYSLGAVDYLRSPVDPEVLRAKVMVFVELFTKNALIEMHAREQRRRAWQLQLLADASLRLHSAPRERDLLAIMTGAAAHMLQAQGVVTLTRLRTPFQVAASAHGADAGAVVRHPPAGAHAPAPLARELEGITGTTRLPPGASAPWAWLWPHAVDAPGVAVPLLDHQGNRWGVMAVLAREGAPAGPDDEAMLVQLAQMASVAHDNLINWEAREANRIKDEFLAVLSHELRTPLTAMLGWTRMLRRGQLDEVTTRRGIATLERCARTQARLIEDLLDISRIVAGKMLLQMRPLDVGAVVTAAVETTQEAAQARSVRVLVEPCPVPARVLGDATRLQQVVWNLVANAVKFSAVGGTVMVRVLLRDGAVAIAVSDTGQGITPEMLPYVFEPFRQGDSSATRQHGGLGLGLSIAQQLVHLHGGTLTAHSDGTGHGSVFLVSLPALTAQPDPELSPPLVLAQAGQD